MSGRVVRQIDFTSEVAKNAGGKRDAATLYSLLKSNDVTKFKPWSVTPWTLTGYALKYLGEAVGQVHV